MDRNYSADFCSDLILAEYLVELLCIGVVDNLLLFIVFVQRRLLGHVHDALWKGEKDTANWGKSDSEG